MLAAGAIAGSMALGAGAGALLFTPALSSAQSTTSTTAPDGAAGGLERHGAGGHGAELQVAAQTIGITVDQLRTELQGGKTIAEVAKAHDVDPQKVIDAIVADAKAKLQQAEADLPNHVAAMVNGQIPLGGRRPGGPGLVKAGLDTIATTIGITRDQLRTELQGGKTIAEVAKAHDVDPQKVIDAIVAESTKRIDEAVTNGKLTSDQAAKLKANLSDVASHIVNDAHPPFGPRGGHRGFGPDGPDGTAPTGIGTSTS
jgi:DNA-directed RNA polymerase specialized sigma subunit